MPRAPRTIIALAGAAAITVGLVLLVGACGTGAEPVAGSTPTGSSSAAASFADADVTFAQMMIPHHQQAVQMSELLLAKSGVDGQVRTVAGQIRAAQAPEIATMTGWLTAWGRPAAPGAAMDAGMDGMMSAADLATLASDDAAAGQRLYLTGMIRHHQGAVAMAQAEVAAGKNPDALALARSIVTTQSAEITTMQQILTRL